MDKRPLMLSGPLFSSPRCRQGELRGCRSVLVVWLAFVIVGFAIKTLLWLAIVEIVLFVATGIYGAIRSRTS